MSSAYHPATDGQTERVNQQVECYLRSFISSHPAKWSKWLSMCEFWYNTNWHSAVGKTPFEILYGHTPRYFGISASDTIAAPDIQHWLQERQTVLDSVTQHLHRAQQRMKYQADKHRTERSFVIGDMVFLKLQPYVQSSVVRRANHKLSFKYFGPYKVIDRIGEVAYKLQLPASSKIHPVFHVSQLKKVISPTSAVQPNLPFQFSHLQVPVQVLQSRVRQVGQKTVAQGLILWSDSTPAEATWEDLEPLRQQFPRAAAWGQAATQQGGDVSDPLTTSDVPEEEEAAPAEAVADYNKVATEPGLRPKSTRPRNLPQWLASPRLCNSNP